jgi:hypothetical protein
VTFNIKATSKKNNKVNICDLLQDTVNAKHSAKHKERKKKSQMLIASETKSNNNAFRAIML